MLLLGELERALVGDVLADALLAGTTQADDGGETLEAARHGARESLERVLVDGEGQVGDALVGAHAQAAYETGRSGH